MPAGKTYTMSWTFTAANDADANGILADCDDFVGSFAEGGSRGVTGCHVHGGGVTKILDSELVQA